MSRTHKGERPKKTCRVPRRRPYGWKGTDPYCGPHDMCWVYGVSKGSVRQRLKRELAAEPREPEWHEDEYVPPCSCCATYGPTPKNTPAVQAAVKAAFAELAALSPEELLALVKKGTT